MPSKKITFIGGGSYQWVPVLFRDIAVNPFLKDTTFVLHDIDLERNDELAHACRAIVRKPGVVKEVELERRKFKSGWDYEVEIVDSNGAKWQVTIDAKTGKVNSINRDWF